MKGIVKRFNKTHGYGFIETEDGRDAFFHYSQIVMEGYKYVDEGSEVEFTVYDSERGLQAQNVVQLTPRIGKNG
ncbi:MAG: cold shock domain-containing protein [Erysipelotrichaceae bacterium]|nr:cold shock domain-containing protein [Erysipelotrichaceae bacterium]